MSQSTNLYQMSRMDFEKFSKNPESYNFEFNDYNSSLFDQNFEGLHFLFSTFYKENLPDFLDQLFYPQDFIGEEIDYNEINFDDFADFPESNAIYFLNPVVAGQISKVLTEIDKNEILKFYDADTFNENDVYPNIWHNDESENQAFNRRHLEEGLELLKETFTKATSNGNYILFFSE